MISGGREVVFIAGKPDLGDDGSKPSVKVIFCSTDSFGDTEVAVANGALIEVAGFRASLGETLLVDYGLSLTTDYIKVPPQSKKRSRAYPGFR